MGRPAAVGLVDLEARDRDGAGLLGEVHPELAEEAVGASRALLDRDHALHVAPGGVEEDALREEVAGRVAADVVGVRGQVEQLLVGAEHDLDLLDGAPIALEAVVDAAPDEPAAELGERPVEVGALADHGVPVLEDDLARPEVLDARDPQLGVAAEADLERAAEQGLALADRGAARRVG